MSTRTVVVILAAVVIAVSGVALTSRVLPDTAAVPPRMGGLASLIVLVAAVGLVFLTLLVPVCVIQIKRNTDELLKELRALNATIRRDGHG